MKVLLFIPQRYGFYHSFQDTFTHLGAEVYSIDYYDVVKKWEQKVNTQIFRLPKKYHLKWESYYLQKINQYYIETYDRLRPDIVFIYNNELLLPDTLKYFKKKGTRIGFFLGDSPFYTPTNRYYLQLLEEADAIFAPDSFWIAQLQNIGLQNIYLFYPTIPSHQYFKHKLANNDYQAMKTDVLYIGMSYADSWGYKKAKFLSHFTDFDLQIFGNRDWKRWFNAFPALADCYTEQTNRLSTEKVNDMYNATKIIPIDGNPGILHGVHWRMIEALCAGALPLMEWQNGLYEIFPLGSELPAVHSYDKIKDMASFYLNHESERTEIITWMRAIVFEKYSIENNADRLSNALELNSLVYGRKINGQRM